MRPVSARFLAALTGSHRMDVRARIVPAGLNGTLPDAFVLAACGIVSGSVTLDATADVRSTLDLEVSTVFKDTSILAWPTSATDPLTPYGNELFIERGIVFGDGSREWVSQGYFRINTIEQQEAPLGSIHITGSDRMIGIKDARLPTPLTFAAGTPVINVFITLVQAIYPWAVFDYDASLASSTLQSAQVTTDDRYKFLADLAKAYGMIMYWDHRGILSIHPIPSITTPVATISSGANGVLVSLSRSLSRDGVYNGCVASGEQLSETIPPVTATVVDSSPTSPTYWYGSFGPIVQFFSSSFLTTTAQCTSAATSILSQSTGLPYSVDFGHVPNPALEPLDPVTIAYPGRKELHVLSQLVIPLDTSTAQTGQTRQLVTGATFT